MKVKEEGPPSS